MEEHFFAGRGIFYRANRLGLERSTLLFIHGISGSSSAWLSIERRFENSYNVISLDVPGHGRSNKPTRYRAYALEAIADDVEALLHHLHVRDIICIAHSFGTLVIPSLVQRYPARAVILVSPPYGIFGTALTFFVRFVVRAAAFVLSLFPFSTKPGGHVDYARFPLPTSDWYLPRILADVRNTTLHVCCFALAHAYARPRAHGWKNIRAPSLIVHGERDSIVPLDNAVALSKELSSELLVVPSANHVLPINNADELSRAIADFIRRHL